VLAKVDDPDLAAYVAWVPKNGAREKHVDRVTRLVTDPRASQYWDEFQAVMEPYRKQFKRRLPQWDGKRFAKKVREMLN
jgi:hypothetical protein